MTQEVAGSNPAPRVEKLYAITRADLGIGMRAAQVGHALIEWTVLHGKPCENLVVLQVPDRASLEAVARRLGCAGRVLCFREPDLDDEMTAIAAGPECWRQLSGLRLMR
jgi:hypothetical protein